MIWSTLAPLLALAQASWADSPGPLLIPASEYFEGNDGPWSTFDVRIGKPEQHVRVLVSTASPQSMVVLSDLGCSDDAFESVPPNCAVSRGTLFDIEKSTTWVGSGDYEINGDGVGLEANLGYSLKASWGLDELAIGLTGPKFQNQTIAAFAAPEPMYLGVFGLNSQPVNFTSLGNFSAPSFLTTLKEEKKIPSLSWSYTAGAKYRLKQVYGQLIFSGYDTSRFSENSVSFTMAEDLTRDLVVGLQSISYSGSSSQTLLSDSIDIFVDSTDPNLWLPGDVCDAFEEAFGLTLDEASGLYLVNDTHRNNLLDSDAEVTFRLSDVKDGGDTVSITLPYAAFDLKAEEPLVSSDSYYFPLRRASNSTQYTLGRVFLQEAYLSADYERKTFNVSACVWDSGAEQDVVTIPARSGGGSSLGEDSPPSGSPGNDTGSHGLSGGAIAGIVVGSVLGAVLLAGLVACCVLWQRRRSKKRAYKVKNITSPADMTTVGGPVRSDSMYEAVPYSSADVSGWTPSSTTPPRGAVTSAITGASSSTSQISGQKTQVIPKMELDGKEIPLQQGRTPKADTRGVFELAGSKIEEMPKRHGTIAQRQHSLGLSASGGSSTSPDQRVAAAGGSSPDSPDVSTLGTAYGYGERPDSHLVSPANTTFQGRPY